MADEAPERTVATAGDGASAGASHFPAWSPGFRAALERVSLVVRRPARGGQAGAVRSRVRGRALEFADYRPYTAGDDPRLVDWRAYARLDRLYLKQYEEERSRTLTLLIDASASMDWGDGEAHKGLYARQVAAALAWIALSRLEPVRAYLLHAWGATPLPPVASRQSVAALFQQLGQVRESGQTRLAEAVRAAMPPPTPGPVVLLSDLLDSSWPAALDTLSVSGEGMVLQVLAPAEWHPPLGEEVELEDAESGALRPTRLGPAELAAYRARLDAFLAEVGEHARRLGLVHAAIDSGTPLRQTVLRDLAIAGVLR